MSRILTSVLRRYVLPLAVAVAHSILAGSYRSVLPRAAGLAILGRTDTGAVAFVETRRGAGALVAVGVGPDLPTALEDAAARLRANP